MSFANIYHLRRVAEASAKPCEICYKPTTAVLITPDKIDFFYVCLGHLKDKGFASAIIDEKEMAAKKKEELEKEVEIVKKEYEGKQKKKKEKEKEGKKGKEKDEEKRDKASTGKGKEKEEDDDKAKSSTTEESTAAQKAEDTPRVYSLHKTFYQARLNRARNAELARRNRERLKNPSLFPSVPKSDL